MEIKKSILSPKNIIAFACAFSFLINENVEAQVEWPAITKQQKPWTRWWWEGSAVNEEGLSWNLQQYRDAGLGGVEITPIYGIHGAEQQFVDFLSPRWMQLFSHALKESRRLGLGVDLANGTGWPFGGTWVTDEDASKTVYHKTYTVEGGQQLGEPVLFEQEALVRTANNKKADINQVKRPLRLNKNLQELALDQIQFPGRLPLIALMAYDNKGGSVNLVDKVDANGKLRWTAPATAAKWTLYAMFEGLHGKMVERAAPGGEGYAIDHFSKTAAAHYFKKFDEAFKGYDISYLRSFFNDSYEVDDARGEANWTPAFFDEFKRRRGYDLREHLPALFGKANAEMNSRIVYDYRSVIDELLLEHFTKEWKKWGESKGAMLRNQSHGSPANTLDLYSVVDIPETEGNDILRFKFATSAANVSGKQLVSAEAATWLNEHFLSSWGDVKKALDLYFLGGVNHIFYHGTEYSPKEAKWPGWLFYAAVHFQPENPQWRHFHALNKYVARVQSFLQSGQPDNDILLYYPIVDRYAQPGNTLLQHFDGMERNFVNTDFEQVSHQMVEKGYSFDFFSDRQLQQFTFRNGQVFSAGNGYKALMLPGNKLISDVSFAKLIQLVKQGATLLVYKSLPQDVPGYANLEDRRKRLVDLLAAFSKEKSAASGPITLGKGTVVIADDLERLMKQAHARKEKADDGSVYTLRRKNSGGHIYFINNRSDKEVEEWIRLADTAEVVAIFDPASDAKGLAKTRQTADGHLEVWAQLQPYASLIFQSYDKKISGAPFPYQEKLGAPVALKGTWKLEFLEGGPVLPNPQLLEAPVYWTELKGEGYQQFSGIGKYTIAFDRPGAAKNYLLDLGALQATAEVVLNGKKIATLTGPTFKTAIPAAAFKQKNQLEIIVANLMANRIIYMDRNHQPWKIFYNTNMPARKAENVKNGLFSAAHWQPLPSGLKGPVTLTPLK
ncbi:glycosyl hydrolase [Niabella insulamsoli]|uniref:glycosyl hydrolase n=1 Tax=Niabella insulamsoli TaxID=3144874 RepID=UPI0031FCE3F6